LLFKMDSSRWSWLLGTLDAKDIFEFSSFQKARLQYCVPYVRTVPRIASLNECVDPVKSLFSLPFPLLTNAVVWRQGVAPWVWLYCGRWRFSCALVPYVTRLHCVRNKEQTIHNSNFRMSPFSLTSALQMSETISTVVYIDN
jgi:hypothetical protein